MGSTIINPLVVGPRIDPFPQRFTASLRYCDIYTIATTGTQFEYGTATTFVLNSLFAPVSGGHQPYGYDTLATLYNRYKVVRVDMELALVYNGGVQNSIISGVVLPPGTSATIAGSVYSIVSEKPRTMSIPVVGGTNMGCPFVKQRFDIADLSGLTRQELQANVEDYSAAVTAAPSKTVSFEVAACGVQTTTATSTKVLATFVFHAEFWERKILTQS